MNPKPPWQRLTSPLQTLVHDLERFPLYATLVMLRTRFKQDRLGLSASSLTFTATLALVPLFTLALSVFTAFPMFGRLQGALERWLAHSLIPASIARNVIGYLTQFSSQAGALGITGFAVFTFTAVSLVLTIDRTLNDIWRVRRQRSLGQRVLVYWAVLTLGPLVLAASLAITSYVVTSTRGWTPGLGRMPGGIRATLALLQFALLAGALTLLYRYVPNTPVRWRHAGAGGLLACLGLTLARQGLSWYLGRIPAYSVVYGAFATLPILLLWIYLSWLIVLFGAVIAAYLPSLLHGMRTDRARPGGTPGWQFELAAEALQALARQRGAQEHTLSLPQLAVQLKVDPLQLQPVLAALQALDWVGQLATRSENEEPRLTLLIEPDKQALRPLIERLLLHPERALAGWWNSAALAGLTVADLLAGSHSTTSTWQARTDL